MSVLQVEHLTKRYGQTNAVDEVTLTLEPGRSYGLIGRNGAGKTTLMRLITGLAFPTAGTISLFSEPGPLPQPAQLRRLGCLIEAPGILDSMSAAENLRMHRMIRGIPSRTRDGELLELVGLSGAGRKRTRNFSLGMKQRLGIAIALLASPELLILDEPVNGLDPSGVVEVRRLLAELQRERGITMIISSHNLPELYQTATDYILMDQGQIRQTLTLAELEQRCQHYLRITTDDPAELTRILETEFGTRNFTVVANGSVHLHEGLDDPAAVLRRLTEHGIYPSAFVREGETLESYFLSVVGAGAPGEARS